MLRHVSRRRGPLLHRLSQRSDPLAEQLEETVRVDVDADVCVRLLPGAVPEVDDRPAAAQLRLAVDVHVPGQRLHDPGPEDLCDRDCVVDRRASGAVRLAGGTP